MYSCIKPLTDEKMNPISLFQNSLYRIELDTPSNILKFIWEENHPTLTYPGFIEACCNFIGYGFEYQTKQIYINTQHFNFTPPPEFRQWQDTVHYDRYRKIGVEKVAYVMNAEHMQYMNNTPATDGGFATHYFSEEAEALKWLSEPVVVAE